MARGSACPKQIRPVPSDLQQVAATWPHSAVQSDIAVEIDDELLEREI